MERQAKTNERTIYHATHGNHSYYDILSGGRKSQVNIIDSVMPNSRKQGGNFFSGHEQLINVIQDPYI